MKCPTCHCTQGHDDDCPQGGYDLAMRDLAEAQPAPEPGSELRRKMDQDRVLAKLAGVWHALPELRLGQLLENAKAYTEYAGSDDCFYVPDDDLERGLERLHDEHVRKGRTEFPDEAR